MPLSPAVVVRDREWNSVFIDVAYDRLPPFCSMCSRFGHSAHCCPYTRHSNSAASIPSSGILAPPLSPKESSSAVPSPSDPPAPELPPFASEKFSPFRPPDFPLLPSAQRCGSAPSVQPEAPHDSSSNPIPRVFSLPKKQPIHLWSNNQPRKKSSSQLSPAQSSHKLVPSSSDSFVSSSDQSIPISVAVVSPQPPSLTKHHLHPFRRLPLQVPFRLIWSSLLQPHLPLPLSPMSLSILTMCPPVMPSSIRQICR